MIWLGKEIFFSSGKRIFFLAYNRVRFFYSIIRHYAYLVQDSFSLENSLQDIFFLKSPIPPPPPPLKVKWSARLEQVTAVSNHELKQ